MKKVFEESFVLEEILAYRGTGRSNIGNRDFGMKVSS